MTHIWVVRCQKVKQACRKDLTEGFFKLASYAVRIQQTRIQ